MAFETILAAKRVNTENNTLVYSNRLEDGETIEGYFTGYQTNKFGGQLITLQSNTGAVIRITETGNLTYLRVDAEKQLTAGAYTLIKKVGSRPSRKNPKDSFPLFDVQQDKDRMIDVTGTAQAAAPQQAQAVSSAERLAQVKAALKIKA